ncbi:MAG TPA: diaminopimelate epimerase [Candidatus Cybelea sp.]
MFVTKMHGARNDFVVGDVRRQPLADASSFARWVCDRRAGVGADGLILIEPSRIADVRMRIINADGSEAEMCGNGVRCAARWLDEAGEGDGIAFETEAGIVRTTVLAREPEYLVRVGMGRPRVARTTVNGSPEAFVDLGNPHVVLVRDELDAIALEPIAQSLQNDPQFAGGTNVHVAAVRSAGTLSVRHWERGVGLTQACGTGAVACAAVAIVRGLADTPVNVLVPGGRLIVEWDGEGEAFLIGPAVRVFDTQVSVAGAALR